MKGLVLRLGGGKIVGEGQEVVQWPRLDGQEVQGEAAVRVRQGQASPRTAPLAVGQNGENRSFLQAVTEGKTNGKLETNPEQRRVLGLKRVEV